ADVWFRWSALVTRREHEAGSPFAGGAWRRDARILGRLCHSVHGVVLPVDPGVAVWRRIAGGIGRTPGRVAPGASRGASARARRDRGGRTHRADIGEVDTADGPGAHARCPHVHAHALFTST